MADNRLLLPQDFGGATPVVEEDERVDSLPYWEAASVGAGPRVLIKDRDYFARKRRFAVRLTGLGPLWACPGNTRAHYSTNDRSCWRAPRRRKAMYRSAHTAVGLAHAQGVRVGVGGTYSAGAPPTSTCCAR